MFKFVLVLKTSVIALFIILLLSPYFITSASDSAAESDGESSSGEMPSAFPVHESIESQYFLDSGETITVFRSHKESGGFHSENRLCIILIPSDMDLTVFSEETQWPVYSKLDQFDIAILTADWDNEKIAEAYFMKSMNILDQIFDLKNTSVFLIGYEDGAGYAAATAVKEPQVFTGMIALGGEGADTDLLDHYNSGENKEPLSVWFISSKKTAQMNSNLSYWKESNNITGTALRSFQQKFADVLYLPVTSTAGKVTGSQESMGMVLFSRESDLYNSSLTADIARNFITKVSKDHISFRESVTGGEIYGFNDFRFSYNRMQLEGQQRDYWMFTPLSAEIGDSPACLLLCLHGNGGNGEEMIFRSMWHEIAESNNCIVVYPSSLYKTGRQHYWQNLPEELLFIRKLTENICENYNVDRSRIYVTGFSNGAGMAQNLAVRCSDIFAAAALGAPVYYDEEYYGPVENSIHEMAIIFSYGSEDPYLKEYHMTADINDIPAFRHLEYWRAMYGFQQKFYKEEKGGIFTMYTYTTKYHIPVVKWFVVEGKGHEYPKEETGLFWDFMSSYTRGEDGHLYYNGTIVQSK